MFRQTLAGVTAQEDGLIPPSVLHRAVDVEKIQ